VSPGSAFKLIEEKVSSVKVRIVNGKVLCKILFIMILLIVGKYYKIKIAYSS
jgi:hypothetical protein